MFGSESLADAIAFGTDGFKIHTSDLDVRKLLGNLAGTGLPVVLGVGGRKRIEIPSPMPPTFRM